MSNAEYEECPVYSMRVEQDTIAPDHWKTFIPRIKWLQLPSSDQLVKVKVKVDDAFNQIAKLLLSKSL